MSDIVDQSLGKIARGTGAVSFGMAVVILSGFLCRVLLARFFTTSEYGIYSLAIVLLNILVIFTMLGLHEGLARQIAYYRGRGDDPKVGGVIASSLQIAIVASVLVSLTIFFASDIIAIKAFHEPGLSTPLKIVSLALPFSVLMQMFAAVFRGFDEAKPKVYFDDLLRTGLFILLLLGVLLLHLPFLGAVFAFSASLIIGGIAFAIYTIKRAPFSMKRASSLVSNSIHREMLLFSLPLVFVYTLNEIMQWTDTLIIGLLKTAYEVGLYNAAVPLAQFVQLIMGATVFIYKPVVTGLYSQGALAEIKQIYQSLTRWVMLLVFPVFLVIFLFPKPVINIVFGQEYVGASPALRILALAFLSLPLLGPQGSTLMAMGKNNILMCVAAAGAIVNIVLNFILVPLVGIAGAATATLVSWGGVQLTDLIILYKMTGIHPFSKSYYLPMAISLAASLAVYFVVEHFLTVTFWMPPIILIVFWMIYLLATLLTRSFDEQALKLVLAAEKRTGMNLSPLKSILGRFI